MYNEDTRGIHKYIKCILYDFISEIMTDAI